MKRRTKSLTDRLALSLGDTAFMSDKSMQLIARCVFLSIFYMTGHPISTNIPYSVEIKDSNVKKLGDIKAESNCELYKKIVFWEIEIVDIMAKEISFPVSR